MLGLLLSENWNRMKMDKTKWYSIAYEKFQELEDSLLDTQVTPIVEILSEEDSEKMKESAVHSSAVKKEIPYAEIIGYLNEKTGKGQGSCPFVPLKKTDGSSR
jgi:hypothetical protein